MKDTQKDFGLTACGRCPRKGVEMEDCASCKRDALPTTVDRPLYKLADRYLFDPVKNTAVLLPANSLPVDAKARKAVPIFSGVLKYFPDAIIAVAKCSFAGNEQHHPGTPLHWDKSKSTDHEDCLLRHLMDDLTGVPMDGDTPHLAKVAWRALALLQTRMDAERGGA